MDVMEGIFFFVIVLLPPALFGALFLGMFVYWDSDENILWTIRGQQERLHNIRRERLMRLPHLPVHLNHHRMFNPGLAPSIAIGDQDSFVPEVSEWCEEHLRDSPRLIEAPRIDGSEYAAGTIAHPSWFLIFSNHTDAMAFKMRWM